MDRKRKKILVLTSRYTATRDIISEDFGRQVRLFSALKKIGHDIDFFCVDYNKKENRNTKLHGMNIFIRPFSPFSLLSFISSLNKVTQKGRYDVLIATSDPLWGVFGLRAAKKYDIPFLYDLHDNYEVYQSYSIPFFKYLDHSVIRKADLVTTVSTSLKKKISSVRSKGVHVIENGADQQLFKPKNQAQVRKKLKLPAKAKIIAYTGTIQKLQGVDLLIQAVQVLEKKQDNLFLALSGRKRVGDIDIPKKKNVKHFTKLDQKGVVDVINAADVVVVPNKINEFTKYCFPYKVVEYMSCQRPIAATKVGDVGVLLANHPKGLCKPESVSALAQAIERQLSTQKVNYHKILKSYTWDALAKKLDGLIQKI